MSRYLSSVSCSALFAGIVSHYEVLLRFDDCRLSVIHYSLSFPSLSNPNLTTISHDMTKNAAGLTLIELMVTLAVVIILLAVGIPSYGRILVGNRIAAQTNALVTALTVARSQAVDDGRLVTLCAKSASGNICDSAGNWGNGWLVFVDLDADGTVDSGDSVIRVWGDSVASFSATAGYIQFRPDGSQAGTATATFEGTVYLDPSDTSSYKQQRCVRVSMVGQIRTEKGACS